MIELVKILDEIINDNLNPVWEIACYTEQDDTIPDEIIEHNFVEKPSNFDFDVTDRILFYDYEKIEISLIGQTNEGENETCYNLKTIIVKGE